MIIHWYCVHNWFIDKIVVYISFIWFTVFFRRNAFHQWSTSTTMRSQRVYLFSFVTFRGWVGFAVRHWFYSSRRYATFPRFVIIAAVLGRWCAKNLFKYFRWKVLGFLEKRSCRVYLTRFYTSFSWWSLWFLRSLGQFLSFEV